MNMFVISLYLDDSVFVDNPSTNAPTKHSYIERISLNMYTVFAYWRKGIVSQLGLNLMEISNNKNI